VKARQQHGIATTYKARVFALRTQWQHYPDSLGYARNLKLGEAMESGHRNETFEPEWKNGWRAYCLDLWGFEEKNSVV
jgi:hypothetical protein